MCNDDKVELQGSKEFKCPKCGANLEYAPGEHSQICPYCKHEVVIAQSEEDIKENDYHKFLAKARDESEAVDCQMAKCSSCGATVAVAEHIASDACPYCGSDLIAEGGSTRIIKPKSLLPFKIKEDEAQASFKRWLRGLWFAPNALKKLARVDGKLTGLFVPYWTYDCQTTTFYRGQRGDYYWVTEYYTTTVNGKSVQRSRQVRKTRWSFASGTVWNSFDDILVLASKSLPQKCAVKLEPWDLKQLVPYQEQYLSGFKAENYQVDLEEGMEDAKKQAEPIIVRTIKDDIGGDCQRISSKCSQYDNISFKHILLPVWLAGYKYQGETYQFLVNARTGEVQGERPWSWLKISLFAIAIVALIATVVAVAIN